MQTTSELYKTLLAGEHKKEVKAVIAGVEYTNQHLIQCSTLGGLYQSLSIGNAAAKRINLKIFPQGTIPRQARIELYVRLVGEFENRQIVLQVPDWLPAGVYSFNIPEFGSYDITVPRGAEAGIASLVTITAQKDVGVSATVEIWNMFDFVWEEPIPLNVTAGSSGEDLLSYTILQEETVTKSEAVSEWIQKGVYFFAERETDRRTGVMTILGYDAMLKADQVWLDSSYDEESWPMPVWDAVNDIAARMGVEIDPRTTLNTAHPVHYPVDDVGDMTMRTVLRRIAVANGGNWRMTDEGKLLLVPLKPKSYDIDIGNNVAELSPGLESLPITKVEIINENGEIAGQAGSDTGRVLTAESQEGTDAMAADILAAVTGYVYRPYDAVDALIDPAAELGDGVMIGGVYSVLANENITFDGLYSAGISAPGTDEIEDEYPYLSEYQRIKRSVAGSRSLITKTMEEIRVMVEGKVDEDEVSSLIDVALGKIELSVKNGKTSSTITLKVGETEIKSESITFSGVVTFDALSGTPGTGTTKINGGWIDADTLNLSGKITFNDFDDETQSAIENAGGISAEDAYTLITDTLVSSPTIQGGRFYDLRKYGKLTLAEYLVDESDGVPWLKFEYTAQGSRNLFDVLPIVRSGKQIILRLGEVTALSKNSDGTISLGSNVIVPSTTAVFA